MRVEHLFEKYLECNQSVSTDSRKIEKGNLFIALKGANFNGNQFADEALAKGARYAVVDEPALATSPRHLLVADGLKALQALAQYRRQQLNIPIIAITGSNGKTTTKELLNLALAKKYNTFSTQGNLNNHIGVPLTLLAMPSSTEIAVIEMGDNRQGDIAELCQIAQPTHGYITNIGKDHLEGFGSFENNIRAKGELFDYLQQHHGTAFVSENDPILLSMAKKFTQPILFGRKHYLLKFVEANPFVVYEDEDGNRWQTQLIGQYNFDNIQAVYAIARFMNVATNAIHEAICSYVPKNNRSQLIHQNTNTYILDAYNANPSSMEVALRSFAAMKTDKRKLCLLGDMLELGETSSQEHRHIIELTRQLGIDAFFCGKNFYGWKDEKNLFFNTREELENYLKNFPLENTVVLLKGSRGMAMEKILT